MSGARWLKKLGHELSGYKTANEAIPADTYLNSLNMLLVEEAADWAESHPEAIRLLNEPSPTQDTVTAFKALFCDRFPSRAVEAAPIPFNVELAEIAQRSEESLSSYYKRVIGLMQRVGAKDRPVTPSAAVLSPLEAAMLDIILRAFIKGISDHTIQKEATRGMASSDRSLRMIYTLAEEARRTNLEIQKLFDEEVKSKELLFYKELAQKNMTKTQIEALRASYHATENQRTKREWTMHVDPPEFNPPPTRQQASYYSTLENPLHGKFYSTY